MSAPHAHAPASASATAPAALVDPPPVRPAPPPDPVAMVVAAHARSIVRTISATSARSQQSAVGMSELVGCARRLSYRFAGAPVVHRPDPLAAFIGTGFHAAVEEGLRRLDAGVGRYLIEHRVTYRGVPGHVDLYDRWEHLVADWKTTQLKKLSRVRSEGPSASHRVQIMGYAAGLRAQGYRVENAAIIYVPTDGTVDDIHAWRSTVDTTAVDEAIDRLSTVAAAVPSQTEPTYTPLCNWCPFHNPASSDLDVSCPGRIDQP